MAAAGEASLSAIVEAAIERLSTNPLKDFGRKLGINRYLNDLRKHLLSIHDVLSDAESRYMNERLVLAWLDEVKDAAYDADDLVDELATDAELLSQRKKQVSDFDKDTLINNLKEINERLKEIDEQKKELGLKARVKSASIEMVEKEPERLTSSLFDENHVFGRNKDKDAVAKLLMSDESWQNDVFGVVPIVGLGGLGKTTLAQLVYNDEFVDKHFDSKTWICVSDDFNPKQLTKSILETISNKRSDLVDLNHLQIELQGVLRGKKFLIVLDDVWNQCVSKWDLLRLPFIAGAPGSRIIVTTRSEKIAKMMSSIQPYNLEVLSDDDCWSLFKERAFPGGDESEYSLLVPIGKEILKKCKGLPLAAKTLGGLLRDKRDVDDWNMILKSEIWNLEGENIMPALRLSYNNLPACLKQCFMYCSIFPKDYNFDKDSMILLWMAEGFVQSKKMQTLEKVASGYFDDLWLRSFFQKSKTDPSKFVMHDLIHDLSISVAGEICCSLEGEKLLDNADRVRHSSVLVNSYKSVGFDAFKETKGLRTMLFLSSKNLRENANISVPDDLVSALKCLRSWDLSQISIKELPDEVGNLIHMRYLDLSHTHIIKLPESTRNLYNLQTLILVDCNKLLSLPEGTQELIKLRHLNLTGCWHLKSMPPNMGKLTAMQKLHRFVAGKESGCRISELKNMNELRATLCIDRIEDVVSVEEAKEANLKKKEHIQHLVLRWSRSHHVQGGIDDELLQCLEPHVNIKSLKIDVYPGSKFPSWMGNSLLYQLEKIEFFHCNYCQALPQLGQLPLLKDLTIHMMSELETIGREFYGDGKVKGFPSLKKLKLEDMRNLKEWQEIDEGEFPELEELSISNCPNISSLPKFPKIHELVLDDCQEDILKSIQFLTTLSSLKVSNFRKTGQLPAGFLRPLKALKELKIHHFYRLKELKDEGGLQDLPSVQSLEILCCPKLVTFPTNGIPSTLQRLSIGVCSDLKDLPNGIQKLTSLEELNISKCPKLAAFPNEKLPVSLKNLKISACANLESLPQGLHELRHLEHLSIESCQKIGSLPDSGLSRKLKQLSIRECPVLEGRCQEGGADWEKIKDIPNKWIKQ